MSETITKEDLTSFVWSVFTVISEKMAEGKQVNPNKFMGMLCFMDMVNDRFNLGIKIDGLHEALKEMSKDKNDEGVSK